MRVPETQSRSPGLLITRARRSLYPLAIYRRGTKRWRRRGLRPLLARRATATIGRRGVRIIPGDLRGRTGELNVVKDGLVAARNVMVAANGVLRGDASVEVTESVVNNGRVEPGSSIGRLRITGDYVQQVFGTLAIELGGHTQGKRYDHLQVAGTATLSGTLQLDAVAGFHPKPGQPFVVLTADSITGTFDSVVGDGGFAVDYGPAKVTVTFMGPSVTARKL